MFVGGGGRDQRACGGGFGARRSLSPGRGVCGSDRGSDTLNDIYTHRRPQVARAQRVVDFPWLEELLELLRHVRGAARHVHVADAQDQDHGDGVTAWGAESWGAGCVFRERRADEDCLVCRKDRRRWFCRP